MHHRGSVPRLSRRSVVGRACVSRRTGVQRHHSAFNFTHECLALVAGHEQQGGEPAAPKLGARGAEQFNQEFQVVAW